MLFLALFTSCCMATGRRNKAFIGYSELSSKPHRRETLRDATLGERRQRLEAPVGRTGGLLSFSRVKEEVAAGGSDCLPRDLLSVRE